MKVVIAGGSGHVGSALKRGLKHDITVLSRSGPGIRWDGKTLGEWAGLLDGADVAINLAGRSVSCRYTDSNLREMMDSRVLSTRAIGQAIRQAKNPPKVWLQASTATIYAHRFDAPNDEATGIIGGNEPDVPRYWAKSIDIARAWEAELEHADTPHTRKVALRSAMIMSIDKGSVFRVLSSLAHLGLGGAVAGGRQFMSWIHETDFCRAIEFLIERDELSGPINVCSPEPIPQAQFAETLRKALGVKVGPPQPAWLIEIGTRLMRTESELILKSRRVVPGRLLDAGFQFGLPDWESAARDLVLRSS